MNANIEVKNRLLEFGVKPSLQRMAIMAYLMDNLIHPNAETIFNHLYPLIPTLSKTTVYNTLKLLEEHGAILAINIDEKNVRYDADISEHAHFKCKRCGVVYDLPVKGIENLQIESPENLQITESRIYYKGYCEKCKKKMN
ncbi:transcriptional repressor [Bacteroidia bacterium]|nr:transcriptional repressor [Bacteroidia bacterium]GHT27452.1 transcriptional repressor [Bacteroidia bacterium]